MPQQTTTHLVNSMAAATNTFDAEISAGNLSVRLAREKEEITAAQHLRYRIFYEEMGGHPSQEMTAIHSDFDEFDPLCDHLLVLDNNQSRIEKKVVGTYRLLRRSAMQPLGRFYTQSEFDISAFADDADEILELGRSCVNQEYRSRAVMQLLWRGIANYVDHYGISLMFGCASFPGSDPKQHAEALSYLYHYHLAPQHMRPVALPSRFERMDMLPKEALVPKRCFAALPALIKGYLRLSGAVGDGAVIDTHCNTVDVSIIVKTDLVTDKYIQRYSPSAEREE